MNLEGGIPSKRGSLTRVDYVPALCTHRPSLLPIECVSEVIGVAFEAFARWPRMVAKTSKLIHLEEVKVVTRFP